MIFLKIWILKKDSIYGRNFGTDFVRFALVPAVDEVKEAGSRFEEICKPYDFKY